MSVLNNWVKWVQYTIISLLLTLTAGAVFPGSTLFLHNLCGYQEDKASGLKWLYVLLVLSYALIVILRRRIKLSAHGKAVLVTGCDSGFGFDLAQRLDKLGMIVFAGCHSKNKNGKGAKFLKETSSSRLKVLQLDVTDQQSVDEVVCFVKENLPPEGLWALVNNAGTSTFGEVEWCPIDLYKFVAEVNLYGGIRMTQACLPLIRRAKGRVVFMASGLSRMTAPGRSPYCTTKYAIQCLARVLKYEMKRWGVKVSVLEPGNYISGTNTLTKTKVCGMGEKLWSAMSQTVKKDYGKEYFDNKVRLMHSYCNSGQSDVSPVTDGFVSALVDPDPKFIYQVFDWSWTMKFFVMTKLPDCIGEFFYVGNEPPAPPLGKI